MEAVICVIITGAFTLAGTIISTRALHKKSEQNFAIEWALIKRDMNEVKEEVRKVNARVDKLTKTEQVCGNLTGAVQEIKENLEVVNASIGQLKAESATNDEVLKHAVMCMIRHIINASHKTFMKVGFIDENSKASIMALGEVYVNDLHGNSFVESELHDIEKLPIKREV